MYDIKEIYEAMSVAQAVELLSAHPEAKIIAGGSDVLIKIREGKMAGCELVSIFGINELKGIKIEADGTIVIGPVTSFSSITKDSIIQKFIPVLGAAVDQVGGPQIRNIGTIGGNISNGVTSADSASTLFALNAKLEITGPSGTRKLPIQDYYQGPGKVDLKTGELLTAIRIEQSNYEGFGGHYIKYAMRNAMDIATLACVATVKLNASKNAIEEMHLALGVAGPIPMRCPITEEAVKGKKIDAALFDLVGKTVLTEVNPRTSWRASKEFRLQLVEELSKRALKQAIIFAGGALHD
ncbi:MAG: xanthine dehydrogenase subunit XdhB [Clostridia bacterium]